MALQRHCKPWIGHDPGLEPAIQNQNRLYRLPIQYPFFQGATCQPLNENASLFQPNQNTSPLPTMNNSFPNKAFLDEYDYTQGPFVAPHELATTSNVHATGIHPDTMDFGLQSMQSTPPLIYDSSPEQYGAKGFDMDWDILNNTSYASGINYADYQDFPLVPDYSHGALPRSNYPGADQVYIDNALPELNPNDDFLAPTPEDNNNLFHDLNFITTPPEDDEVLEPATNNDNANKFTCQHAGCTESFTRQCDLTRHELKHTKPFQCQHCGREFAEKRRCIQHIQSVHGIATEKDKTKCYLCQYASIRPDAVKRHLKLKHGVTGAGSSPSTNSEGSLGVRKRRA
jgi:hypothetical protein